MKDRDFRSLEPQIMVLTKRMRTRSLSVKILCLIGAALTCISIFRYQQMISRSANYGEDITFRHPVPETDGDDFVSDVDDFRILNENKPKRIDITCCGIGHRFDLIAAAARDLNKPIEVNWGPCKDLTNNIFGKIFKTNSLFIPYQSSEGDAPFPRMRDLTGVDKGRKNLPIVVQEAFVDLLLHNLSDEYMDKVNEFKEWVGWDETHTMIIPLPPAKVPTPSSCRWKITGKHWTRTSLVSLYGSCFCASCQNGRIKLPSSSCHR